MKIDQYCQRQRCKHVEWSNWHAFASRWFVSDSWAFLFSPLTRSWSVRTNLAACIIIMLLSNNLCQQTVRIRWVCHVGHPFGWPRRLVFFVTRANTFVGQRSFTIAVPVVWNALPPELRSSLHNSRRQFQIPIQAENRQAFPTSL